MPRVKSESEKEAGKLISSIQKEWVEEFGESTSDQSELVLDKGHELLQQRNANNMIKMLSNNSIESFLGEKWIRSHPAVLPAIQKLALAIQHEKT